MSGIATRRATRAHSSVSAIAALSLAGFAVAAPVAAGAQEAATSTRYILSIGHHPRVDGLRLNFRDRDLELVRGANVTIWQPEKDRVSGMVKGLALGLPLTGAGELRGLAVGIAGVAAEGDIVGITFGGLGAGAGGDVRGIAIGGAGLGAGGAVRGLAVGGLGVGAGSSVRGIAVGGLGIGTGGDARGAIIGGLGAGVGGDVRGLAVGGLGVGAGGSLRGIAIGGLGVGAGGDVSGLMIGGVGVGAGGTLRGVAIAAGGVGSPDLRAIAIAPMVGGHRVRAVAIAPVHFKAADDDGRRDAEFSGVAVSAVSVVRGHQHGLTLGLVNIAETLTGVQVGAVNIVWGNPAGRRVLPVINWGTR